MADRVALALENRSPLVIEAGTGTGKTFAYLVPALQSRKRVLISTGTRTLQDQLFNKDLPQATLADLEKEAVRLEVLGSYPRREPWE